ncbi:hypothetical protein PR202_gb28558 [Eleusine coracana subsp. coracana]|uniref:ABC transporter domain-containing protein n=1 Tax=Eleusine coracana subsp. coracana TaxID=191504 RepID=A0AAV5FX48_ELECO|nr:hypothetical protein PR202_gb28558 [Eleusine coracana subsp. coracana]
MAPLLLLLVLSSATTSAAQTRGDMAALAAGSPLVVGALNDRLKSVTTSFAQQMGREFHYCIKNMDDEWNTAFNFSSDPTFLTDCMKDTDGDLPQRVCTAAEMKFFFESFLEGNGRKNYVRPNKNCNLTSWIDGCEPGWACSAGKEEQVNLTDAVNFPSRTLDCRGCCAGFFCPHGLTCMIRKFYCRKGSTSQTRCLMFSAVNHLQLLRSTSDEPGEEASKIQGGCCKTHARETAMARERWKSAKDVAKKHAAGVISMATEDDIKKRPAIEIAFKDLTLTLKGSKKKLLRSVTGKLMPGRVAAVMGPSGAGKTTFLSAIAGKATGCDTTGMILINGKMEPIRAYKRIIGFVPQDDIVHGNLTVQENLWFNARCRLSADMSKADKVLVVERVIESLGLQAVRDSLVGTVEQRGISGGQRKRVNVGLEMVMEPSVLILDEPTSGLDSASSLLLLRALRREALEGVNISMVVHQPSYTLYNMFDDLILLAKGGMTVYHGPVKKVEEYFAGLGIVVPERVNPPDYYIDILEGIVKPSSNAPVNVKDLPLRWMLHNGYEVPRDMLQSASDAESSFRGAGASGEDSAGQSIAGEVWGNVRDIVGQKKDEYDYNKSSENLSNRRTPGILRQYKYYLGRQVELCGKQRLREARIQGVDYLILGLAGICLGTLAKRYVLLAALLCKIGALRSFSLEKIHYWRERASGMSSLAYFLSKDTIDHFNTIIKPMVYLSMFYFFNNPRSSIWENYVVLVALVYCVTGIGYTFAIFFQPSSAQLWSALLPVVLTLIATNQKDTFFANLCYTKWALEAFVIANAQRYSGVWLITRCGSLMKNGYDINDKILCIVVLAANGVIFRCVAFFCMVIFQKH